MTDGRLAGRVALVTGGGQGVGRGIALALTAAGAAVTITGRTADKLEKVAREVAERGGTAHTVTGDVGMRADVERMVAEAVRAFGTVDILVNNAQSSVRKPLAETTEEDVDLAFRSGALATFTAMRACLPYLKRRGGNVVNLGSSTALAGRRGFGSYAMAKEAIRGLTRVASQEWGPYGIRVNAICPAAMSPASEEYLAAHPEYHERVRAETPLGRLGDAEADIGRAVVALVSDDMAYLTGATLMLEGGRTLLG